jgi:flagellar motor protein MotB
MKATKKVAVILTGLAVMVLVSGCTDWKKKYEALNVEHENLKGLYDNCVATSGQATGMADELASCRAQVQDLTAQLEGGQPKTTGFEGMDQSYDPSTGDITVTLPNALLFDSGKVTLKSTTVSQLDEIISVLRERYAGKEVDIVGNTDTDPIKKSKWQDNWQLGSERALAVVRYLQGKGVNATELRAVSCGEYRPLGTNKAQNRRVEVVVHTR